MGSEMCIRDRLAYHMNSTILWEIADRLYTNDILQGDSITPADLAADAGLAYTPNATVTRTIGGGTYSPQVPPTLDNLDNAIRRCRSGIIGNMRPDIDDVYCIMSEDMFLAIVRNNETEFRNTSLTGRESTYWSIEQMLSLIHISEPTRPY